MQTTSGPIFSLLYPADFEQRPAVKLGEHTATDLGLDELVIALSLGPPRGHSYAKGIAVRNGISFEQLAARWRERTSAHEPKASP